MIVKKLLINMESKTLFWCVCLISSITSALVCILLLRLGCFSYGDPVAITCVERNLATASLAFRITETNWRIPSEASTAIMDEIFDPIKVDCERLAEVCLFVHRLYAEQEPSDQQSAYFLERAKWHAIFLICENGSTKAFDEFRRLRAIIGRDGGPSLLFESYEKKYFADRKAGKEREKQNGVMNKIDKTLL